MIINSVYTKKFYRRLHESIYGPVGQMPSVASQLDNPSVRLQQSVSISGRAKHLQRMAYRVSLLYDCYQSFLLDLAERGSAIDLNVEKLAGCHPEGVFFQEPPNGTGYYCKRYGACPWCRFRTVNALVEKLIPHLAEAKHLAYITLSAPVDFLSHRSGPMFDLDESVAAIHKEYSAMIKIICKQKNLFFADRVITLPNWRKTSTVNDPVTRYSFNIETTIIGLMDEQKELPLPENCISPVRQQTTPFFGVGRGTWSIMKPTKKSLQEAVARTMGFSPMLFSKQLDLDEYLVAMALQSQFKAVGHGKAR